MNRLAFYLLSSRVTIFLTTLLVMIFCMVSAPFADARTTTIKFPNKNLVRVDKFLSYVTADNIKVTFENENSSTNLYQTIGNEFIVYPCNIPIEADTAIISVTFNYSEGLVSVRGQQIFLDSGVPKTYEASRNLKRVTMSVRKQVTLYSIVIETADGADEQDPEPAPGPDPNPNPDPDPDPEPIPTKYSVTLIQPTEGGSITVTDIFGKTVDLGNVADGTRLLVKATPDAGYELDRVTADGVDITATGEVTVKSSITITAFFKRTSTLCNISPHISCVDGNASVAGQVKWKFKGSADFDCPVKVERGKVITVSIEAADGYCITEASGMTLSADSKVKDLSFDLTVNDDTEITATFKAIAKGVLALYPSVTGLPSEAGTPLSIAVSRLDGTQLSATSAIEVGTKIRITATLNDERYRIASMMVNGLNAVISSDGSTATLDSYELSAPVTQASGTVFPIELDIDVARRTVLVSYTVDADNATVSVTSNDSSNSVVMSGDRVATDTDLRFKAVPDAGYEIEAMTVVSGTGDSVVATPADIDDDGVCVLTIRTPLTTGLNLSVKYAVYIKCRRKETGAIYRQHTVTLAVAEGQANRGVVRFIEPAGTGLSVSTRKSVTFEAVPSQQPADSEMGQYSFAGWSNNASVDMDDPLAEVQIYGGDNDVIFTAHFRRNCRILFTSSPDNGTMRITRQDGSVLSGGGFVAPGSTVTVTVKATESEHRVSAITVNGMEMYRYPDNPEKVSQQIIVDADMLIGCVITRTSGISDIESDSAMQPAKWFTLQGVPLGTERPDHPGIYIAVYPDGRAAKIALTE